MDASVDIAGESKQSPDKGSSSEVDSPPFNGLLYSKLCDWKVDTLKVALRQRDIVFKSSQKKKNSSIC